MEHLLEVLKIIDGALTLNTQKAISYAELLAEKLDKDGENKAALRIRQTLQKTQNGQVQPSSVAHLGQVPVDGESRISLADEDLYSVGDVSVFVEEDIADLIERFLSHISAADQLVAEGVGIAPSMLMYGPPGCGKTVIGQYIAGRVGLPLLTARTDGLISSYLGNTAKNLRALFEHAMGRPCILFLDEFDAIAKLRDDHYELGELKRVVVSLLQNIDSLDNQTVIIAATNHEHLLDPAIWRRFAFRLKVDKPSTSVREKLFDFFLGNFGTEDNCKLLAALCDGATGADIRQISEDAKREAILSKSCSISFENIAQHVMGLIMED